MTVPTGHKEFWGDGSGNAQAVTAVFVAGTAVNVYGDSELILNLNGAGTAATFYEIQVSLAQPGSSTWNAMPVVYGSTAGSEYREQESLILRVAGSNGDHPIVIKTPPQMQVRLDVRRSGGAADTTALVTGYVREVTGESSLSTLSQAAGASSGIAQDVNITEIDGTAVAPNVAGFLPVEADVRQIAGQNVANTVVNGTMPVEGTVAHNVADDGSGVLKTGGIANAADPVVVEGRRAQLSFDLANYERVVDKAWDVTTTANKVSNQNLDSTNHDTAGTEIANVTNVNSVPAVSYPSAAGQAYGDRGNVCWTITIDDVTSCELLESDDGGTTWAPVTGSLLERNTGMVGYAATYFTSAAGVSTTFKVQLYPTSPAILYRWDVLFPNATNDALIVASGSAL